MNCCLPLGQKVYLYSLEEMTRTVRSNRPNLWFRLILIGGGGTFQKLGPFGAGGGDRPHHWADLAEVGPLGVHYGQVGP
jgi:hypothetical protein